MPLLTLDLSPADLRLPLTAPREDGPAMRAALDAISSAGRRARATITKERAHAYLDPATRWQLDMVWNGLSGMATDEALAVLARAALMPSYGHRVAALNLRGARLAFRWLRMVERAAEAAVGRRAA